MYTYYTILIHQYYVIILQSLRNNTSTKNIEIILDRSG